MGYSRQCKRWTARWVGVDDIRTFAGALFREDLLSTAAAWAKYDGCAPTAAQLDERIDVDADVTVGTAEAETTVSRWTGCGSGSAVELWTVTGGGHIPNVTGAFLAAVFDFLSAHPKP